MSIAFRGAYTAIVTPFSADGSSVDFARLEEQVRFQGQGKVTGVVPCGTTGESPTLSDEEQREVIATTLRVARPLGLQVVAGAGSNNTVHAVEMHRYAKSAGADASLQVSPYYNKPSQEGLYRHFMTIADSCDLPIMLYNIPGRCGVAISPETVERLSRHPNIKAIKEATGSMDSASEIAQRCGITILSGDDSLTLSFAACGSQGVVSVVSNLVPATVQSLCDAFLGDRFNEAKRIHRELFRLCRGLLTLDINPVPVKTAMRILGRDSGVLRLPMVGPGKDVAAKIGELLAEFGLKRLEAVTA
ncbi:MAG: 4-hydroxy-tetrahydrodipicolinate synthase [Phycisphaerae bacterium]|jgi:4-hydroxy-tetrahydrodipicolinate synthase|nr:4-hydroxy-tetrahydrodipicolinate synthase [Phycisphaerae bacterium]